MPQCWSSVQGKVLRATRVDECGIPVPGTCAQVTTDGFISVQYSPEIAEGEEIEVRKANGALCVSDQGCPEIKWINIEATFCNVDPDLFTLLTGYPTVLDHAGEAVGNRITGKVQCATGAALEVWTRIPGATCGVTGFPYHGYFLVPWLTNGIIGDFTLENDAASFVITGRTQKGSGWDVGPYDVDATGPTNTPGPLLTPIGPDDHMDMHATTIAPPAVECGCQALVLAP